MHPRKQNSVAETKFCRGGRGYWIGTTAGEEGATYGPFVQLDELPCECFGEYKAANGVTWINRLSARRMGP